MAEEIFAYGSNRITIDREHCYLEINARKHSKKYTLDRDLRAIEKLKEHIERWGYFWIDGNGEGASKHGICQSLYSRNFTIINIINNINNILFRSVHIQISCKLLY